MKKVTMVKRLWNRRLGFALPITRFLIKVLLGLKGRVRFGPRLTLGPRAQPLSKRHEAFPVVLVLLGISAGLLVSTFPVGAGGSASSSPSEPPRLEEKEQERKLLVIDHGDFNKRRPSGFYRQEIDLDSSVCQPLLEALNKPHQPPKNLKVSDTEMVMGNEFSVEWTELKPIFLAERVWRAVVDVNNDGASDVLYRQTRYMGKVYYYELSWTTNFPQGENAFSLRRAREVTGSMIPEGPWKGAFSNVIYFLDKLGTKQSFHPPLPNNVKLPSWKIYDIVHIGGRHYLLLGDAMYWDRPLHLFVVKTRGKRDHSLVCLFASNYIIRSHKEQKEEQGR